MAIGRWMSASLARMGERMKIMGRQPPPTAAELEQLRRESGRDKAELDELLGDSRDTSHLPTATVRRT